MAGLTNQDLSEKLKKLTLRGIKPVTEQLGKGAFGRTHTVHYHDVVCAAKEISQAGFAVIQRGDFERECVRCSELLHPNIIHFLGVYYPSRASLPVVVMEMMDENLTQYLGRQRITLKRKISILHDIAEGLRYLHTRSIPFIHCNLSPNNVLLKCNGVLPVAKISDLCMAGVVQVGRRNSLAEIRENTDFLPPEVVDHKYGLSFDVFSYGAIMLYMINQEWPVPKPVEQIDPVTNEVKALCEAERRKEYLDKLIGEAEVVKSMIENCLCDDPDMRPTIAKLSGMLAPLREFPPLISALQSGSYELSWNKCRDLPFPLFFASVALLNEKLYIMAGTAPEDDVFDHVYCYSIVTDKWERIANPGQYYGVLHTIDDKLTIIGGRDIITRKITNKLSSYTNKSWTSHYPNLLKARSKPGVVSYSHYIIVAGGGKDEVADHNDIELLDLTQPSHWVVTNVILPEPMWNLFPTVSKDMFCIVGYSGPGHTSNSTVYQLEVDIIISSSSQPSKSNQAAKWMKLPDAPYSDTRIIPYSYPPVIVGGHDIHGAPTSDVTMLDYSNHTWKRVASLSSPRDCVAVVSVNSETIIVLGGVTTGSIRPPRPHYLTMVEKGRATLTHQVKPISVPTENSMCCIQ